MLAGMHLSSVLFAQRHEEIIQVTACACQFFTIHPSSLDYHQVNVLSVIEMEEKRESDVRALQNEREGLRQKLEQQRAVIQRFQVDEQQRLSQLKAALNTYFTTESDRFIFIVQSSKFIIIPPNWSKLYYRGGGGGGCLKGMLEKKTILACSSGRESSARVWLDAETRR